MGGRTIVSLPRATQRSENPALNGCFPNGDLFHLEVNIQPGNRKGASMLAWLISSSVRLRTLVVVVAAGLLIVGAVDIRNKPLDVIPELALPSLTVKTESLGLSSAEVESLI